MQIINWDKKSGQNLFLHIKDDFIERFLNRLIMNPKDKILVGITGESASGKSTICQEIIKTTHRLNLPVTILSADNYFNDISTLIKKYGDFDKLRDSGYDVDAPENFQLDLMAKNLEELKSGCDILAPKYLVNGTGVSVPSGLPVKSNKIIVVEGMATMLEPVKDIFDIKIYVEIDNKIRKKRFIGRAKDRNQDKENAQRHWEYVIKAGERYIQPARSECDIIASGECDLEYFSELLEYINLATNSFEEEV
ncbi:MAG: AAA family ATPase [Candidatus Gastranaerophilales bacterium]|nr:AAA family ATPase [Candidatus Gastranaerophilales bacterium]